MIHLSPDMSVQNLPTLRRLSATYDVVEHDVHLHGWLCRMLAVRDTNALIDRIDPSTFDQDERLPYWAELWKSSLALGTRLIRSREFGGKHVLELGCGLGLAGIAAARSGAHATLTDYEHDALDFAGLNADRNLTHGDRSRTIIRFMDWREPDLDHPLEHIMGADVLYERRNFPPLQRLLAHHLAPGGYALFADPGRSVAGEFLTEISALGYTVSTTVDDTTSGSGNVFIHAVHKPPCVLPS